MRSEVPARETAGAAGGAKPGAWRRLLLGLAISLLTLEAAARAVFPVADIPDFDRLDYANAGAGVAGPRLANTTLWWWSEPDGAAFTRRTNLYGFRDRQWRLAPPRHVPRVAFVGDSFVEGLGTPDGTTIPDGFEQRLRERSHRVEAINLGAGGFSAGDYLALIRDAAVLFAPDDLILVLYMNDVYRLPEDPAALLAGEPELARANRWKPRLLEVHRRWRSGAGVPLRWHRAPAAEPQPLNVAARLGNDSHLLKNIEKWVDPEIAESMKAGRLNPAITNLLRRSHRVLREPIDLEPVLAALKGFLDGHGVRMWVVYLPSLNQVSDRYLPDQLRLSAPIPAETLTGPEFQLHARQLADTCRLLEVPFLDLTPALAEAEAGGEPLYWPYDAHMTEAGYREVARQIAGWWVATAPAADAAR